MFKKHVFKRSYWPYIDPSGQQVFIVTSLKTEIWRPPIIICKIFRIVRINVYIEFSITNWVNHNLILFYKKINLGSAAEQDLPARVFLNKFGTIKILYRIMLMNTVEVQEKSKNTLTTYWTFNSSRRHSCIQIKSLSFSNMSWNLG